MRRILALAAAMLVAGACGATDDPFAGLPHIRFDWHPITGTSVAAIADALESSADRPSGGGSSYGHTAWSIRWHWRGRGPGRLCRVFSADVTFGAVVTLPRLEEKSALDEDAASRWAAFSQAIARHEAGHAHLAHDGVPQLRRAILTANCDDADKKGRAVLHAIDRRQEAYDRETRYGATQGAHFP